MNPEPHGRLMSDAYADKELKRFYESNIMNREQQILLAKYGNYKTSHVLHLILSVLTVGLWLPIWALCGLSNCIERKKIERKVRKGGER